VATFPGITDSGQIVGSYYDQNFQQHGFVTARGSGGLDSDLTSLLSAGSAGSGAANGLASSNVSNGASLASLINGVASGDLIPGIFGSPAQSWGMSSAESPSSVASGASLLVMGDLSGLSGSDHQQLPVTDSG
jgi:hypothetical protein